LDARAAHTVQIADVPGTPQRSKQATSAVPAVLSRTSRPGGREGLARGPSGDAARDRLGDAA
jgi:hypothetical protein